MMLFTFLYNFVILHLNEFIIWFVKNIVFYYDYTICHFTEN